MIEIWTDGATIRSNPGLTTWGVYVRSDSWSLRFCGRAGFGSSNYAELIALNKALRFIHRLNYHKALIYTDSQYCAYSLGRLSRSRKHTLLLRENYRLKRTTEAIIAHIPRRYNKAHAVAQRCKER